MRALTAPGDDRKRFSMRRAATVQGYVANVKVGGVESVDCHTKDPIDRDTHIELTLTPDDPNEATHVIMEVTPRWRALMNQRGSDWSTSALRRALLGRWIEVNGDGLGLWHLFELHSVLRYIFHHDWPARGRGVRHHHLVPQLTLTTISKAGTTRAGPSALDQQSRINYERAMSRQSTAA